MIAVLFEAEVAEGGSAAYLDLAALLAGELAKVDGFLSVERFQSLGNPKKILSLSFFRDEQAIDHWRNTREHRAAQARGRGGVFADYRLRIAVVSRDYGLNDREQAPADSRAVHRRPATNA